LNWAIIAGLCVVCVVAVILIVVWIIITPHSLSYGILLIFLVFGSGALATGLLAEDRNKNLRNIAGLALGVAIASALFISTAAYLEGPPRNNLQTQKAFVDMTVLIDRVSPLDIPVRNYFDRETTNVTVTIYPNSTEKLTFESLILNMSNNSIMHQNSGFKNITSSKDVNGKRVYQTELTVPHTMATGNITSENQIIISYLKGNSSKLMQHISPFDWTIKTMDLSPIIYFTIVMIGVLISRIISLMLKKIEDNKEENKTANPKVPLTAAKMVELKPNDSLWLLFSFIISVLIFAAFNQQVHLGPSIMVNIVLAFGFGFGFEKVLEVATRFNDLV
jgi:hypothetical protein